MERQDVEEQLKKTGLFESLSEEFVKPAIDTLYTVSTLSESAEDDTFIVEGEESDGQGYMVLSGAVHISKSTGKEIDISAPALIGEMSAHGPQTRRGATVTTTERCTLMAFIWPEYYRELEAALPPAEVSAFRIAVERYSWDYLLGEGLS